MIPLRLPKKTKWLFLKISPRSAFCLDDDDVGTSLDLPPLNLEMPAARPSVHLPSDLTVATARATIAYSLGLDLSSLSTFQRDAFVAALAIMGFVSQTVSTQTFVSKAMTRLPSIFSSMDQAA